MKKSFFTLALLLVLFQFGCKKNSTYFIDDDTPELKGEMTVFRDCSGDFLLFEGKLYDVCNYTAISKFGEGTKLLAGLNKGCDYNKYPSRQVCELGHLNAGGTVTIVSLQPIK